ncbi:MAG: hypothetical protein QY332_01110 [Anaerolineales bacterium]|nr:MAG: hypothetical protein QY332_01110 [Anaerolineales bacterium]
MEAVSSRKFLQVWMWALAAVSLLAIPQTIQRTSELEITLLRSKWIGLVGIFALTAVAGLWLSRSSLLGRMAAWMDGFETRPSNALRSLYGVFLTLFGFFLVWFTRLYLFGSVLPQLMPILWVFLWASLLQVFGLKLLKNTLEWHAAFAIVLLGQGVIYQAYGFSTIVSSDPFSIGYSEAGRHYYASMFFAKSVYGVSLPYPFLHPSRYLLLSLPFLVDGLPLWFHRLWQVLLWIGLTSASAMLLARRLKLGGGLTVLAAAWLFLFYLQGAVYYHLQVCVILVFAGISIQRPWRSLLFVIIASVWAGISRVNWFPVPAMLAIAIYILETPLTGKSWRYWVTPVVWGAGGLAAALVSQFTYIRISGNADVSTFGSSFTSDLLWKRLLPTETFPMGIVPGILIVSAPLMVAAYQIARGRMSFLHPLRWLALLAMLLVLFAGGVVVSTKIGGGGDLHNMDAYLVLLSVLVMSFWAGRVSAEGDAKPLWGRVGWMPISAALLIPLAFAIRGIGFFHAYDRSIATQDIQRLQEVVSEAIGNGGEVLFVTERHLLTFGDLNGIPLVPEYEQVELMEMAMSRNRNYLEQYYADLADRRFALIVAEDQKFTQRKKGAFVEENVAWVRYVGAPLLCNYKPAEALLSNNIQIFEPRPGQAQCKDPFLD